jgi:hypothetical protein
MAVNETVGINIVADTRTLRTQLREATQDFLRLQASGSATASEINNAAKRAADLKERISDAKDTIAAFNPEAKFKAFGQVIQGVAGAFAATVGARCRHAASAHAARVADPLAARWGVPAPL